MKDTAIENLNAAQEIAVTDFNGPMLIIAGAGTGKTRVITSRIVYLMTQAKVPSINILALTFTEKAANEMEERVDIAMPYSYEEVKISTFHSFCDYLLRSKGIEIGLDSAYKLLNKTEQWLFLKKNLYEFKLDYYRPLGNPNKNLYALLDHISRLRDEDIKPEAYIEHAKYILEEAGDEAEKEEGTKMLELACFYQKYEELLVKNNYMDFGSLQYYALRLLENRPSVLKHFQKTFQYILVDEFQDTNYAQYKLVSLLAKGHGNLTVVGDDDQSIYKWRGASLSNILNFEKDFPGAKKVVLTQNYRSTSQILDASYTLIQNNNPYRLETRENINKKLTSNITDGKPIEIWHFSNFLNEAEQIAEKIKAHVEGGGRCGEIAVLTRTNNIANVYVDTFERHGIPFSIRDTEGLLRVSEIKDIIALLKVLINIRDDAAFFRLMALPVFNIPMSEIVNVSKKAKHLYEPIFYYLKEYLKIDDDQVSLPGFDKADVGLIKFYHLMHQTLEHSRDANIGSVIHKFLKESGYFDVLSSEDTLQNVEKLQNIGSFLEITRRFETEENENSIRDFIDYLELLEHAGESLSAIEKKEEDSVSILTVHSAKGLEFDLVFIPSLVQTRFPQSNRGEGLEIPESLIAEELPHDNVHLQEERRLFYVACTRAKKELILTFSDTYEGNKKWKKSKFLDEIIASGVCVEKNYAATEEIKREIVTNGVEQLMDVDTKFALFGEINLRKLSYSQLDAYKNCPLKYKFRYIYDIPAPITHTLNFGTSIHKTVNDFYENIKEGKLPSKELLKEIYSNSWIKDGYESLSHMNHSKKKGWEMMERFYETEERSGFKTPAFLEKAFHLKFGGLTFNGRIDRIDKLEDGTYEVIDYKTGRSKKNENLKKNLQLSLYALACRDYFKIPVSKLSLYFIEDCSKISTVRSQEDLNGLDAELTGLIDEIKNSSFPASPSYFCKSCEYRILCNFAQ
jgi:DNA helicase II / ATP-dependent DNA helicase PcrA